MHENIIETVTPSTYRKNQASGTLEPYDGFLWERGCESLCLFLFGSIHQSFLINLQQMYCLCNEAKAEE